MARKILFWAPALAALAVTACVTSPTGRRQLSLVSESSGHRRIGGSLYGAARAAAQRGQARNGRAGDAARRSDHRAFGRSGDRHASRNGRLAVERRRDRRPRDGQRLVHGRRPNGGLYGPSRASSIRPTTSSRRCWPTRSATRLRTTRPNACPSRSRRRPASHWPGPSPTTAPEGGPKRGGDRGPARDPAAEQPQRRNGSRRDRHRARRQGRLQPPNAALTLWRKMEAAAGSGPPQFMSTHPSPVESSGKARGARAADDGVLQPGSRRRADAPGHQRRRGPLTAVARGACARRRRPSTRSPAVRSRLQVDGTEPGTIEFRALCGLSGGSRDLSSVPGRPAQKMSSWPGCRTKSVTGQTLFWKH